MRTVRMLGWDAPWASTGRRAPVGGQAPVLVRIPVTATLPGLARDPLGAFERIGARAAGDLVRLDLGLFRPYLVTKPEHVQHVLVDNADTYPREGMLWRPLRRLIGYGLGSEGPSWAESRDMLQPMFSTKRIAGLIDLTATAVNQAVADLDEPARDDRPVDAMATMTRIVDRAVGRAFFGQRISAADAEQLGDEITRAFSSLRTRLLLPFLPDSVPLPGSRAFGRAVRAVDGIIYPLIERCRSGATGDDVVSTLCQARDRSGRGLDDREVRDDLVAMFVGASETTSVALTWLWVALDRDPSVTARLTEEIDRVVGDRPVTAEDVPQLRYARMVLEESLRLYPSGWIIPRRVGRDDVIDGVRLRAGSTVLVSPYLTHRIPRLWPEPSAFRPERFAPGQARQRHRFAYLPFGAGPHQCLGTHFFMVEARLIVAAMLGRYRVEVQDRDAVAAMAGVTLRPRGTVALRLTPRARRA